MKGVLCKKPVFTGAVTGNNVATHKREAGELGIVQGKVNPVSDDYYSVWFSDGSYYSCSTDVLESAPDAYQITVGCSVMYYYRRPACHKGDIGVVISHGADSALVSFIFGGRQCIVNLRYLISDNI